MTTLADHLPIYRIRLRTERLELRLADTEALGALADAAAAGVHDPDFMPFLVPWTDASPAERGRSVALWYHRSIGAWDKDEWQLPFVVFHEGAPIGMQEITAKAFAITREVATGSWLGLAHHGNGFGTEMRAAVLHFGFAALGAEWATSGSLEGNRASEGVSRRLGYREDGIGHEVTQGVRRLELRWRLGREDWEAHRTREVEVEGVDEEVMAMLGLGGGAGE
ncbi:GNAT family N-acetyltransferase [Glycomyces sp. NRRL B-16210]|uniref:GNAT family N-acetyltransferase n=1 Tax=Glycomyces sp. NRRL B-16210 TaxID=1463821 RepID=UPI0004C24A22|nr:GNAT family protein [Glycomyces sp. NRRL B-16210]